jgi:VWFA-related protein
MLCRRFHSTVPLPGGALLGVLFLVVLPSTAVADQVIFHGKVVLEDGSPPGRRVAIQRACEGMEHPLLEATASAKTGDYMVRLEVSDFGGVFTGGTSAYAMLPCFLEATAEGYASARLDLSDRRLTMNPQLPDLVLTRVVQGHVLDLNRGPGVPHAAAKTWAMALKYFTTNDWAAAEAPLRAVAEAAPKFAPAWVALGAACRHQHKPDDARHAFERAIALDPKPLEPYLELADAEYDLKDWEAAAKTSASLIQADSRHMYLEAHLLNAVARYQLQDFDGALARVNDLIRLDKYNDYPRAEYLEGLIYEGRRDYTAAAAHMRVYLDAHAHAKDSNEVSERLANLGKQAPPDLTAAVTTDGLRPTSVGEAPVPGGMKAFAAIAGIPEPLSYRDFFLQYCRAAVAKEPGEQNETLEAREALLAFAVAVKNLEQLGERGTDRTVVRLAVDTDEHRRKTERILTLLGWKMASSGNTLSVQPGDQRIDGLRQRIPAALGIDEIDMRTAIEAHRDFQFEIPSESARLIGGLAWSVVLKGVPEYSGGPAEIFVRDMRFARAYSGLGAMDPDAAGALVSSIGLANLIVKYSTLLAEYGSALSLSENHVAVPGGAKAQPVWAKLAGASPQNPALFFRALFEKDQGRLLAFYFDLARADAAHQQFFTASTARAEAFYKWHHDTAGASLLPGTQSWRAVILQELRLDSSGKVVFPGGRKAWGDGNGGDEETLLRLPTLEALAAALQLEDRRGARLDDGSAALLARHYGEWRPLFPYLEKLPALGAAEFQALAAFAEDNAKVSASRQALLLGEWHSLVQLIVLAGQAGSLDAAQAAHAFRQVCEALHSANPSAEAIEVLRAMAGGAELDEAVPASLLRLSGARREAFERVKELQAVPSFHSLGSPPDARKTLTALSGTVYAALLDPQFLLVAEDDRLLLKHNFLPAGANGLFADSTLITSNSPPGTNLSGGFGKFREATQALNRQMVDPSAAAPAGDESATSETHGPAPPAAPAPRIPTDAIFRASGRIVEVYATVTDSRGRYIDDLTAEQFTIQEAGKPLPVFAFENHTSSVSVALLFDTTGSMEAALPSLKGAALQLLDELRPDDSVAVYSFNDRIVKLQPFTTDKTAAKRAVLRTYAAGTTALYDALLHVNHDLAGRAGKKVIIVFTDGEDNSSMLTAEAAIQRAKGRGIPIYAIAEGAALAQPRLVDQLANISHATGGTPFVIHSLADIGAVFQKMSEDLMHGYLLAFQPPPGDDHGWHKIEVVLKNGKGRQVRAREGYYPD